MALEGWMNGLYTPMARAMSNEPRPEGDRIAKLLARAGVASRREIERMIEARRIKIGDELVTTPSSPRCAG